MARVYKGGGVKLGALPKTRGADKGSKLVLWACSSH